MRRRPPRFPCSYPIYRRRKRRFSIGLDPYNIKAGAFEAAAGDKRELLAELTSDRIKLQKCSAYKIALRSAAAAILYTYYVLYA